MIYVQQISLREKRFILRWSRPKGVVPFSSLRPIYLRMTRG